MAIPRDRNDETMTRSMLNKIIEASSVTVRRVVEAIVDDPADPEHHPRPIPYSQVWANTYPAIKDLNVVSPTIPTEYLDSLPGIPYRWPWIYFSILEMQRSGTEESADSTFTAILSATIGTNQTSFVEAQKEIFEIFRDVREILYSDLSLGNIKRWGIEEANLEPPGGVTDGIIFDSYEAPEAFYQNQDDPVSDNLKRTFIIIDFRFQIWFTEDVKIGVYSANDR